MNVPIGLHVQTPFSSIGATLSMPFVVDLTPPSGVPYTLKARLQDEAAFPVAARGVFIHLT